MLLGHPINHFGGEISEDGADKLRCPWVSRPVDPFETVEEQKNLFDVLYIDSRIHSEKRVSQGMNDVLLDEIVTQLANIHPELVDLAELRFADPRDKKVKLGVVIREVSGDFAADEGVF